MDREVLCIRDVCDVMRVSRRTVYNWINASKVEYTRTAGGNIRIFKDTLYKSDKVNAIQENLTSTPIK